MFINSLLIKMWRTYIMMQSALASIVLLCVWPNTLCCYYICSFLYICIWTVKVHLSVDYYRSCLFSWFLVAWVFKYNYKFWDSSLLSYLCNSISTVTLLLFRQGDCLASFQKISNIDNFILMCFKSLYYIIWSHLMMLYLTGQCCIKNQFLHLQEKPSLIYEIV